MIIVSHLPDLVVRVELQRAVLVYGRPDVVAVVGVPDLLQLPHAGDVGQPDLDVGLAQHARDRGEGVELGQQDGPAREPVPVVVEVVHVAAAHVHGEDVLGAALMHDVGRKVVDVAAVQEEVTVLGVRYE